MRPAIRPRRARRLLLLGLAILLAVVATVYVVVGQRLFDENHSDELRRVDAIVVLGGEHDGREDYGLLLARDGYAHTVVLSNPYPRDDATMQRVCRSTQQIEVICFAPNPSTTRGEAMFTQELARKRHWSDVIVVSWRYHLFRARYIFGQCFDGNVVMRSVPRLYSHNPLVRAHTYAYQYGALAKAAVLGCDTKTPPQAADDRRVG